MEKNLSKPMPNKGSFIYGAAKGGRDEDTTKVIKGGDLRARKGLNSGK